MKEHETCHRCGRKLKTEKSRKEGFGSKCLKKHNADMEKAEQMIEEFKEYEKGAAE
jgi:Family of unknown function (DUF6011)